MTEYEDLTAYEYLPVERRQTADMLNVGWLGTSLPFTTGEVPEEIVEALIGLAGESRHVTRGYHHCELCDVRSPIYVDHPDRERRLPLGHAEIHVEGADGRAYSAPTLIIHYIQDHDYAPPDEFQQAVRHAASTGERRG